MIRGLKKPISVSRPRGLHLRKVFLPAAIVLMALAFSCTRRSEVNDAVDRSTIKIGYFGDLTGPTFNFGQSAINGVLMARTSKTAVSLFMIGSLPAIILPFNRESTLTTFTVTLHSYQD